jgi:hypothetical protein
MRRGNVKEVVRYGDAFKLRLVEDIAGGKYTSIEEERDRRVLDNEEVAKAVRAGGYTTQKDKGGNDERD